MMSTSAWFAEVLSDIFGATMNIRSDVKNVDAYMMWGSGHQNEEKTCCQMQILRFHGLAENEDQTSPVLFKKMRGGIGESGMASEATSRFAGIEWIRPIPFFAAARAIAQCNKVVNMRSR